MLMVLKLFKCLFAICISSFDNSLFRSIAQALFALLLSCFLFLFLFFSQLLCIAEIHLPLDVELA